MEKKAPGKGFLKGVGILLIIGGVFGFIGAASNAFVASALSSGSLDSATTAIYEQAGLTAETFQAGIITSVIQGVIYLVAGILGVANCNKIEKANICFICGIVLIAFVLVNAGISAATTGFTALSIVSILASLILPLLYFWGALKKPSGYAGRAERNKFIRKRCSEGRTKRGNFLFCPAFVYKNAIGNCSAVFDYIL